MTKPETFSHKEFDIVLQRFVDENGRVAYSKLKQNSSRFNHYYSQIGAYSPDSHPELFPTENHRLAYWINAYNAATIKTVLSYYPIKSLRDVKRPALAFFLPRLSGFFLFQRQVFGSKEISLYHLENSLIRKRFNEPRIHFALNCASAGCPKLPRYAFTGERLDQQLEYEAKKFFSESRNFSVDPSKKLIMVSSIMNWFEQDFGDIRTYMEKFVPEAKRMILRNDSYQIKFVDYDWSLNDQKIN